MVRLTDHREETQTEPAGLPLGFMNGESATVEPPRHCVGINTLCRFKASFGLVTAVSHRRRRHDRIADDCNGHSRPRCHSLARNRSNLTTPPLCIELFSVHCTPT